MTVDLVLVVGLVAALAFVLVGAILEGLHMSALFGPTALMIVVGGSLGATVMSHTKEDLKHLLAATKQAFAPKKMDWHGTIDYITELAEKARKGGILSLQQDVATAPHPLIAKGLSMAVDGADPEAIQEALGAMIKLNASELNHGAAVWETAGGYSPTLGIMGTVMGLIHVMGNLSEPDTLGPAIAVAFLATFYGVAFANILFLPLGSKIKSLSRQQSVFGEMILQGIIGLQVGTNPRFLRERLEIFMGSHGHSPEKKAEKKKESK